MKLLVVDDEPLARKRLVRMLSELGVPHAVEAESADAARTLLKAGGIDAVLLDVNMPGMDGLSLAALERLPPVIFVTGDPSHAARAFDVDAADFVTKPVSKERLARALSRARKRAVLAVDADDIPVRLRVIDTDRERYVDARTVEFFRAEHKYVAFQQGSEELLVRESLDELESQLAPHGFVRVHRSTLIRLSAVVEVDGGETVVLQSGARFAVSRRSLPGLRQHLRR